MRWYSWTATGLAVAGVAGWIAWDYASGVAALRPQGPQEEAALTDHSEGFGSLKACADAALSEINSESCEILDSPTLLSFLRLRRMVESRPLVTDLSVFGNDKNLERRYHAETWQEIKEAAERHNDPGRFTTFAGYEYSPALVDRGKHHRNIIFGSAQTPQYAVSAFDAASEIDLWKQLEATCQNDCEFLTILHNPNKSWGLAFASETIDGIPYTDDVLRDYRNDHIEGQTQKTLQALQSQYEITAATPGLIETASK